MLRKKRSKCSEVSTVAVAAPCDNHRTRLWPRTRHGPGEPAAPGRAGALPAHGRTRGAASGCIAQHTFTLPHESSAIAHRRQRQTRRTAQFAAHTRCGAGAGGGQEGHSGHRAQQRTCPEHRVRCISAQEQAKMCAISGAGFTLVAALQPVERQQENPAAEQRPCGAGARASMWFPACACFPQLTTQPSAVPPSADAFVDNMQSASLPAARKCCISVAPCERGPNVQCRLVGGWPGI